MLSFNKPSYDFCPNLHPLKLPNLPHFIVCYTHQHFSSTCSSILPWKAYFSSYIYHRKLHCVYNVLDTSSVCVLCCLLQKDLRFLAKLQLYAWLRIHETLYSMQWICIRIWVVFVIGPKLKKISARTRLFGRTFALLYLVYGRHAWSLFINKYRSMAFICMRGFGSLKWVWTYIFQPYVLSLLTFVLVESGALRDVLAAFFFAFRSACLALIFATRSGEQCRSFSSVS